MTRALRASVFLGEDDVFEHHPLYHEIVIRARRAGMAGATVLRGCEGYRASSLIHTTRLLSLAENLPVVVILIEEPGKVRGFLDEIGPLLADATVVVDEVEVR